MVIEMHIGLASTWVNAEQFEAEILSRWITVTNYKQIDPQAILAAEWYTSHKDSYYIAPATWSTIDMHNRNLVYQEQANRNNNNSEKPFQATTV